jgi:hypothetical protein
MPTELRGSPFAERGLFGRDNVIQMVWWDCLDRPRRTDRPLPVIALLGPRGSGKTEVLDHLATKCRAQSAQPFAPVLDLAGVDLGPRGWGVLAWVAYQLTARAWPQFGRLRFPRFTLGRVIVEGAVRIESLDQTQAAIERLLRESANLDRAARNVTDLSAQLPQLLGFPNWGGFLGQVGAWLISSRLMVRLRFRTGMAFFGEALQKRANGGFPALVDLSRLSQQTSQSSRDRLDRVLCEAFLADLAENYERGFRPRNCLVLIDNIDDARGAGQAFLTALSAAKSRQANPRDPLVTVVASRRTTPVAPLLAADGVRTIPLETWLNQDGDASHADWLAQRRGPRSWLYPIRLADLNADTVTEYAQAYFPQVDSLAGFVHSLTLGHPWGVRHVLATLATTIRATDADDDPDAELGEPELRAVLDASGSGRAGALGDIALDELLLTDLPQWQFERLFASAAALDVVTAEQAGLAGNFRLQTELTHRFWLVPGNNHRGPMIHAWIRQLLLRKLAATQYWAATHKKLRVMCEDRSVLAAYYDLAGEQLDDAVDYLNERFSELITRTGESADSWITDFNTITSTSQKDINYLSAMDRYEQLLSRFRRDDADEQWLTILTLVAARWVWSNPLSDPMLTLNPILKTGFETLALRCPPGQIKLVEEAEFYLRGGRP